MSNSTTNIGLTLPTENEYYDIKIVNENTRKIDEAIGQRPTNESVEAELAKKADLSYLQQNYDRKLKSSINLYVSPSGDDATGDGSEAKPFRNIQKALDVLPKNLGCDNAIINVTSGTYDIGFNAQGFYNGFIVILGNKENKPIISADCLIINNLATVQLHQLKIIGSKSNVSALGVLTVSHVYNCEMYSVDIDGIDKTEDGIRISGQSNVGIAACTINNCKAAVSTDTSSGTRGLATAHLYETKGTNNSIVIHNFCGVVSMYSGDISADTQYQKMGGIIINPDGTLA